MAEPALDADSYSSIADIEARVVEYTNGGVFDQSTTPTRTQVVTFIDDVSEDINTKLASLGFTIPVSDADAIRPLDLRVSRFVAMMCHDANNKVRGFNPNTGRSEIGAGRFDYEAEMKKVEDWLDRNAEGLEARGAEVSSARIAGAEVRTTDESDATIEPAFGRKQFGNEVFDFDE